MIYQHINYLLAGSCSGIVHATPLINKSHVRGLRPRPSLNGREVRQLIQMSLEFDVINHGQVRLVKEREAIYEIKNILYLPYAVFIGGVYHLPGGHGQGIP